MATETSHIYKILLIFRAIHLDRAFFLSPFVFLRFFIAYWCGGEKFAFATIGSDGTHETENSISPRFMQSRKGADVHHEGRQL